MAIDAALTEFKCEKIASERAPSNVVNSSVLYDIVNATGSRKSLCGTLSALEAILLHPVGNESSHKTAYELCTHSSRSTVPRTRVIMSASTLVGPLLKQGRGCEKQMHKSTDRLARLHCQPGLHCVATCAISTTVTAVGTVNDRRVKLMH